MIIQVLFVQGGGKGVHDEWDNKIVDSLEWELGPDYAVRYPRMPNEADPTYADWNAALKRSSLGSTTELSSLAIRSAEQF